MDALNCKIFNTTRVNWRSGVRIRFSIAFTFLGDDKEVRGFTVDGCTCYINEKGELMWMPPYGKGNYHYNIFPTPQTYMDVRNVLSRDPGVRTILERDYRGRLAKKMLEYDPDLPTGIQIYGQNTDETDPSRGSSGPNANGIAEVFEESGAYQSRGSNKPAVDDGVLDIFREQ